MMWSRRILVGLLALNQEMLLLRVALRVLRPLRHAGVRVLLVHRELVSARVAAQD